MTAGQHRPGQCFNSGHNITNPAKTPQLLLQPCPQPGPTPRPHQPPRNPQPCSHTTEIPITQTAGVPPFPIRNQPARRNLIHPGLHLRRLSAAVIQFRVYQLVSEYGGGFPDSEPIGDEDKPKFVYPFALQFRLSQVSDQDGDTHSSGFVYQR